MKSLASWCVRHRRLVLLFWLVALVGASVLAKSVGTAYSNSFTLPHTESTQALSLLQAAAPEQSGDTEQVVFQASGGAKVTDPAVAGRVDRMITNVATVPHVSNFARRHGRCLLVVPHQPGRHHRVRDSDLQYGEPRRQHQTGQPIRDGGQDGPGADPEGGGGRPVGRGLDPQSFGGIGTLLGVFLAALVLAFIFRSGFAMALPLISALASLGTAIGVIGLLSHLLKMPQFSWSWSPSSDWASGSTMRYSS